MGSLNQVTLIGRLGRDPETKSLNNTTVANFSVATDSKFKDKSGAWENKTEWHTCVVWGKQAETASQYLSKGSQVAVIGSLETKSWEDKDSGKKVYKTEIKVFNIQYLDKKSDGNQGSGDQDGMPF